MAVNTMLLIVRHAVQHRIYALKNQKTEADCLRFHW